jgi:ABC-type amino acid transport substrate-binding protein
MFGGVPPYGSCANDQLTTNSTEVDCSGMKVCVVDSTTYDPLLPDILPGVPVNVAPDMEAFYRNFREGRCNVLAGDQFETASTTVSSTGYFGEYEVGDNFFSKEPLALVTRQDDSTWSDFVNWIVIGLLSAEEQKITQDRASFFVKNTTFTMFGEQFANMFPNAIAEVGNYGEIYQRYLEDIVPRKAVNTINNGTSGLLYAMPFGSYEKLGNDPGAGSTLKEIKSRGHLNCGVTRRAIFSLYDNTVGTYSGFDIDFCRALSAAIFNGVANSVVYTDISASDRFARLETKEVDVLSRITTVTLSRDVFEEVAKTGFSFSQPNFYDGLKFGGIPP